MSIKKLFSTKKAVAIGGAVALTLGLSGAAFAFFTSTGSGTGSALVGSAEANTWGVSAGAESGAALYPGTGTQTITFTIKNNGTGTQAYSSVTAAVVDDGAGNIKSGGTAVPGCSSAWFTAVAGTPSVALNTSIAPTNTATDDVTVSMLDAAVSQDACQGKTPDITLSVS